MWRPISADASRLIHNVVIIDTSSGYTYVLQSTITGQVNSPMMNVISNTGAIKPAYPKVIDYGVRLGPWDATSIHFRPYVSTTYISRSIHSYNSLFISTGSANASINRSRVFATGLNGVVYASGYDSKSTDFGVPGMDAIKRSCIVDR